MSKTRARRRYEGQLRRERLARRRARGPRLEVVDQRPPEVPWKVTLPLQVAGEEGRRKMVRDGFLAGVSRLRLDLEVEAKVTNKGVTVTMTGIVARSEPRATEKAVWWCQRACKAGYVGWTGKGVENVKVQSV